MEPYEKELEAANKRIDELENQLADTTAALVAATDALQDISDISRKF